MARNESPQGNPRGLVSVLLARFSAIGDVAMTVPVIYSACLCYPDIRFVLVTRPAMANIFVNAPANLSVVGADIKTDYRGPRGMFRLVRQLDRKYSFDAFIDLHDVIRTRLMGLACRLRGISVIRFDKGRGAKRQLTRNRNKVMLPLPSQRARFREAFFKAGLPVESRFDSLYGGRAKADPALFGKITPPKAPGQRWVGVAPFAAHQGKVYPPEMMHKVVKMLAATPGTRVFLLGGGDTEQRILEGWAEELPNVQSLAGKRYGFAAELALFNHLDAAISMDSANMHLAAIAGCPTVSIWGATHPYAGFKGWRQSDADMLQLPLGCRPCSVFGDKPCHRGDYLCLSAIKPEAVFKKIMEKLQ